MGLQLMIALVICIASCAGATSWSSWTKCKSETKGCIKRKTSASGGWSWRSCPSSYCNGGCPDSDERCQQWANIGECKKNKRWMETNCCQACKNGACHDINAKCKSWASGGYCTKTVKLNCCLACKGIQCVDNRSDCPKYSKTGYCTKAEYKWWSDQCCASCKEAKEGKTGTTVSSKVGSKKENGVSSKVGSKKENGGDIASELAKACLKIHNVDRAKHRNTNPLVYDAKLGAAAQKWANYNAKIDGMEHSTSENRNFTGENLAYTSQVSQSDAEAVIDAVNRWYKEIKDWHGCRRGTTGVTTHFTQIVWRATTHLGCGVARNRYNRLYVAARYRVRANWGGKEDYCVNVGRLV